MIALKETHSFVGGLGKNEKKKYKNITRIVK